MSDCRARSRSASARATCGLELRVVHLEERLAFLGLAPSRTRISAMRPSTSDGARSTGSPRPRPWRGWHPRRCRFGDRGLDRHGGGPPPPAAACRRSVFLQPTIRGRPQRAPTALNVSQSCLTSPGREESVTQNASSPASARRAVNRAWTRSASASRQAVLCVEQVDDRSGARPIAHILHPIVLPRHQHAFGREVGAVPRGLVEPHMRPSRPALRRARDRFSDWRGPRRD